MQDEVNEKIVAIAVRAGKFTAAELKHALWHFLEAQKNKAPNVKHGKQTVGQLMKHNTGLTNIEVTDGNIKSFERVARKYNIDFALKKDSTVDPPKYMVFFKARDVDVMTMAFKEYTHDALHKTKKPSIRKALSNFMEKIRGEKQRERTRDKQRGQER